MPLSDWLGIGILWVSASALMVKRLMANKKKNGSQVALAMSASEKQALEVAAARNGVTVEEYARTVLVSSLPISAQKTLMNEVVPTPVVAPVTSLIEQANNRQASAGSTMSGPPKLPSSVPTVQTPQRRAVPTNAQQATTRDRKPAPTSLPQVPPGTHPCFNLSTTNIPGHLQGQCQGVCQHASQSGRICYWPPTSASHCDVFESRAIRTSPR